MGWLHSSLGILVTVVAAIVLLAAYLVVAPRGKAKWLGALTVLAAVPFFYWLGAFGEQFSTGQCYSNVVRNISSAVEQTTDPKALAAAIRALPMAGYETSCESVEKESGKLPGLTPAPPQ